MGWLIDPLSYPFMQNGLLATVLIGATCATLGVYVVLRRMAFLGDALSHTVLPGLVVAYLNGWSLSAGALGAGLLTALGIGWLSRREMLREDTAIGVLFTAMFAAGVLLASTVRSFRDFSHLLFGNVLGVTPADLLLFGGVACLVVFTLTAFHKELELTSFDPTYAESIGLRPDLVRYALLALLTLTVVSAIQAVGVLLTSALLITPAAAGSLLSTSLPRMMLIATAIAIGAAVVGLFASYYLNVSSGAAIVLTCTICFGAAFLRRTTRQGARPRRPASR